jgi:hypothetical protein
MPGWGVDGQPLVGAERLVRRVEVVPSERKGLRPSQAVEHAEAEGDGPPMVSTCGQELAHLVLSPGVDSPLLGWLGDRTRHLAHEPHPVAFHPMASLLIDR